ncbi:Nucleotide-binding alpha-beta plait [Penicillium verhagenii]|uniref:Nucleotide-binding alpha-beta plait n=1 Tax=Penicillium verhagenii TaxID=1562060 RepID=UPI0025450CB7|nr:Nucleotide-binding alpha-beta plait [Penicillium verhagenii]KAJ5947420.1 Nucleotide-binding alpha-beta plait [Penicillium verhagenii]
MNSIRQVQALNKRELENAIPPEASWHADYRDTAYIYIGGLPFDMTEGDIITIFSQYGEPVFVKLIRDKETGKSKGFAFLKYEDQRSTDLAVDNLGGATVLGRMLRVDHTRYKRREDEEEEDNVAKLMGDATVSENKPSDQHAVSGKTEREEKRPLLKEERELQEMILNHDDEDPMKEFLIEEKKEEVARAIERYSNSEKKSSRRRDDSRERSSRHSRRHRSRERERRHRDDRSPGRERTTRRRSTDRERRSQRDRTPVGSRDRDHDDRSPAYERRPRRRSQDRSRRERTPVRSRSPESRRYRSDRHRDHRR